MCMSPSEMSVAQLDPLIVYYTDLYGADHWFVANLKEQRVKRARMEAEALATGDYTMVRATTPRHHLTTTA